MEYKTIKIWNFLVSVYTTVVALLYFKYETIAMW